MEKTIFPYVFSDVPRKTTNQFRSRDLWKYCKYHLKRIELKKLINSAFVISLDFIHILLAFVFWTTTFSSNINYFCALFRFLFEFFDKKNWSNHV